MMNWYDTVMSVIFTCDMSFHHLLSDSSDSYDAGKILQKLLCDNNMDVYMSPVYLDQKLKLEKYCIKENELYSFEKY